MSKANLLFHLDSFSWEELSIDRSKELDDLAQALTCISDSEDQIFGHPFCYLQQLSWGAVYQIISFDDEKKNEVCPWLRHDHQKTLTKLFNRAISPQQSDTLDRLKQEFKNENNGWIGIQAIEQPEYVFSKVSWVIFHQSFVSKNYTTISKDTEYFKMFYIPQLRIAPNKINQLIDKKQVPDIIDRLDTPTHVDDYKTLHGEQIQIHFKDDKKSALYLNGTWKHHGFDLSNEVKRFLIDLGFIIP